MKLLFFTFIFSCLFFQNTLSSNSNCLASTDKEELKEVTYENPFQIGDSKTFVTLGATSVFSLHNNIYTTTLLQSLPSSLLATAKKVLLLGTGIGADAVFLAKSLNPAAKVYATDINEDSVRVAKINIANYGLSDQVTVFKSDLFQSVQGTFDLIIFSPPRALFRERVQQYYQHVSPTYGAHQYDIALSYSNSGWLPGKYDFEGALLKRTLSEFPFYLNQNGAFFLMADADLGFDLPNEVHHQQVHSPQFWSKEEPHSGSFTIHKFSLKN